MQSGFRNLRMLEMGLDAASLKREVIANNIANVDVPGFKRSEVSFEADLKRAVESRRAVAEEDPPLQTLFQGHVARREPRRLEDVRSRVHIDYSSSMRNDGNNVDMEDEVMKLARNQLQYSMIADRIAGKFQEWNSFIRLA